MIHSPEKQRTSETLWLFRCGAILMQMSCGAARRKNIRSPD
jgi:hypothetical protein